MLGKREISLAVRLAGDSDCGIFHRCSDGGDAASDLQWFKFTANNADATRSFDANGDSVSRNAADGQNNVVTNAKLFTFFAT